MQQNEDGVCISVHKKFNNLSSSPSEHYIFRVHDQLRRVNEKSYEPNIIAIGPYHRGKKKLRMMEEHKLRYLQLFLQRENENLLKYVFALKKIEGEIRRCYAERLKYINANDFIEMMLLDGFFIVELMRKFAYVNLRGENDPIFKMGWIFSHLGRDLLLFENQIPFFVLCKLFGMNKVSDHNHTFSKLALHFFGCHNPSLENSLHRGDLQHTGIEHLLGLVYRKVQPLFAEVTTNGADWQFILCATKLREAGIKFEKIDADELFDIKFKNGVIQIPRLTIDDATESFFRNLMAYEQYREDIDFYFVNDYLTLMDCLINYPKDVEILRRSDIIDNWQGDDEVVSNMFNKIGDSIIGPNKKKFYYAGIFKKINEHYKKPINHWMAKLRRNHLSSPWAIMSVIAAVVLLVLTFLQTLFTIMT